MKIKQLAVALTLASVAIGSYSCSKDDTPVLHLRPVLTDSKIYVDSVLSYTPAPGQFVNTSIADINTVNQILDNKMICLGAWGGQITLRFDHTVLNEAGNDIQIQGNPLAEPSPFSEPGVVWVMYDANGNGLADDKWYELKGSAFGQPGYIRDYKVTYFRPENDADDVRWEDNQGAEGVVKHNTFHKQNYYPSWIKEDSYTLEGTLLPDDHVHMDKIITSSAFEYGYADNIPVKEGGDVLDISNAVDAKGNAVKLPGIDFIKIQTGVLKDAGILGEISTELVSVGDLHLIEAEAAAAAAQ